MRIVAGKLRGLNLLSFDYDNIRPTTDRVRENIFNKIQFGVQGSTMLDLFGGTGAVSLEFISRGAEKVITVDCDKRSLTLIEQNFKKAGLKPNIIKSDFENALNGFNKNVFDFVFLDPPFESDFGEHAIQLICDKKLLKDDGMIIYEHILGKSFQIPNELEIVDSRKYGTICVSYIRWKRG